MLEELRRPENGDLSLWVSNFEIYGGKARFALLCSACALSLQLPHFLVAANGEPCDRRAESASTPAAPVRRCTTC